MRRFRFFFLLFLALALKSCEVPDVHPFVTSTRDLGVVIDESLNLTLTDINGISFETPEASLGNEKDTTGTHAIERLNSIKKQLKNATEKFSAVAHGFDAYAKALDDAATAGENNQKVIAGVDKALVALASAIPVYGKVVGVATATAGQSIEDFQKKHTIKKLSDLASPGQDSLIQSMSSYLRGSIKKFAEIDDEARRILRMHQPKVNQALEDRFKNALRRQELANLILAQITRAEYYVMKSPPADSSILKNGDDPKKNPGLISTIIEMDQDPEFRIKNAWGVDGNVEESRPKVLAALVEREAYYQELATISPQFQAQHNAEQASIQRPDSSLTKAGQLVETWATAHHKLRGLLVNARHVSRKDFLAYTSTTQDLVKELKDLKDIQDKKKKDQQATKKLAN